jgi:hypothetical protein
LTTKPPAVSSVSQPTFQRSAAAISSSTLAPAPASRSLGSKARTELDPPVSINAVRVAYSRAAQLPMPWKADGSSPFAASSASSWFA